MKNSYSSEMFNMSNNLLKEIIHYIAAPLTYSINLCLIEGVFPDALKLSKVTPVFKKALGKVFEGIIYQQMYEYLELNDMLSASQFAYRKGRSVIHAIELLVTDILVAFEDHAQTQETGGEFRKSSVKHTRGSTWSAAGI
ncbi:uncharacterized protein LOC124613601 [Schistocerca americana]|uniref:uncharacterized protein LOC124613601 n=1 Tax=Schistocerca americana TaxID=7009 RepID=UPI001F4FF112|nr:uncharacterized protein LOC124613601 [Schistocerca americana]